MSKLIQGFVLVFLVFIFVPTIVGAEGSCSCIVGDSRSCGVIVNSTCTPPSSAKCVSDIALCNGGPSSCSCALTPSPPPPINLICNQTKSTEYHSLRPYPASPCVTYATNLATFCGNNLTVKDTIEVQYPAQSTDEIADICTTTGNKIYCDYTVEVDKRISIDLGGADLPIMGNTGDEGEVINYQNTTETFSDADKVNEYVSWYLEGVTNKKEYPDKTDSESMVNYSGLIAKITPKQIQESERVKTVENAVGKNLSSDQKDVEQNRHDQVVLCTKWGNLVDCHKLIDEDWRLSRWSKDFPFAKIENWVIESFAIMIPSWLKIDETKIKDLIRAGKPWSHKYPPLPWSAEILEDQSGINKDLLYKKAYSEWQGDFCLILPVVNKLLCVDHPLVSDKYAEYFSYIPLTSTEDVEGEIMIQNVSQTSGPSSNGTVVTDVTFDSQETSTIYLSHMEEVDQLGDLLQSTFVPAGQNKIGDPTQIAQGSACFSTEVRSNPGDDLFASQIKGNLGYTAKFTCEFDTSPATTTTNTCYALGGRCAPTDWICTNTFGQQDCPTGTICGNNCVSQIQTCTKDVYINMSTQAKAPLVEEVWSRLVAGPMSVFKRIFPKTNTEGSVGQIIDIPASTNITYSGTDIEVTDADTDLKLPHIGGVSEYFLKGIQTALRPKGYGETITFAELSSPVNPEECSIDEIPSGTCDGEVLSKYSPPSSTTASGKNYFEAYIYPLLSPDLLAIYKEAERQTGVPCEVLAGIHFREGSNDPNSSLQNGGPLDGCLIDSAIDAGEHLAGAVGGTIDSWDEFITALARYNGMGNSNCADPNSIYSGPCPPPDGIDHNYVVNLIDYDHLKMNIIYCWDHLKCFLPYPIDGRPGALTVATELYNH